MEQQTAEGLTPRRATLRTFLSNGVRLLSAAGIDEARLDTEVLLRYALGLERAEFYRRIDEPAEISLDPQFGPLLQRRAKREPIAYITGRKEFWSLEFNVNRDVLVPRPETEVVVEAALERARSLPSARLTIVDVGTGSGAVAVALAKELQQADIRAVDISTPALRTARGNAERHGLGKRIQFIAGDFLAPFGQRERFDLIVSNPPYIRTQELTELAPDIREWEPLTALDGGMDGLNAYRRLAAQGFGHLTPGGHMLLEIGDRMAQAVTQIFLAAGGYRVAGTIRDYSGKERVIDVIQDFARG